MVDRSQLSNAFEFVAVASARARQLMQGCTPRVGGVSKPARLAQREVMAGRVGRADLATAGEAKDAGRTED